MQGGTCYASFEREETDCGGSTPAPASESENREKGDSAANMR